MEANRRSKPQADMMREVVESGWVMSPTGSASASSAWYRTVRSLVRRGDLELWSNGSRAMARVPTATPDDDSTHGWRRRR